MAASKVPADSLRFRCAPAALGFRTTAELPPLSNPIGQPRAFRALQLGSAVRYGGYNIFVLGLPGSGRTSLVLDFLRQQAAKEPTPPDLAYVFNFKEPNRPQALHFPPGQASAFAQDMDRLINTCRQEIPRAFQSESYRKERERITQDLQKRQEAEFTRLQALVSKYNFALVQTPFGFFLVPAVEGRPLKPEEIEKLPQDKKAKLEELQHRLEEEVQKTIRKVREMEQQTRQAIEELDRRTTVFVVEHLVEQIKKKYQEVEGVGEFLDGVQEDIVSHSKQFLQQAEQGKEAANAPWELWARRYKVNVVVDNKDCQGAPVILENHPSYGNLLGRIEHEVVMGVTRTDHTLIRAGALHKAAGGYLVLPVRDVLLLPYAWEGLKRALREGQIRIIELATELGLVSTVTLEPEPVPLKTKVILIGTPLLYYLLRMYDEDFPKLFKVRAEFTPTMPRTPDTEREYALFARAVQEQEGLPPLEVEAVARLVEYGARLAEHQQKLSTRFGLIADLIREAAHWAAQNGHNTITAADIRRAEEEQIYRANYLEETIREMMVEGTLRVATEGRVVGQINGLSVILLGDYAFGRPTRITATAYPGRGEVVDIEQRAELSGPIHTKGVLILGGYLGQQYSHLGPLSLTARLTFEQSYEGVEGDSASAAELITLLSAIAQVPLRQDIAITGAIDQHGNIQAVGGVNEKIEGFFALCQAKGLTGEQGVILPKANLRHLMLRDEVVEAVAQGQFHIWAVETVDEAIALLTGMEPGERQEDSRFPEGTFHHAVEARLETFARLAQGPEEEEEEKRAEEAKKSTAEPDQGPGGPPDPSLPHEDSPDDA